MNILKLAREAGLRLRRTGRNLSFVGNGRVSVDARALVRSESFRRQCHAIRAMKGAE